MQISAMAPRMRLNLFSGAILVVLELLVSQSTLTRASGFVCAQFDSNFPEVLRNNHSRRERVPDHDGAVAYFGFQSGTADLGVMATPSSDPVPRYTTLTYTVTVKNFGPDSAAGVVLRDSFSPSWIGFGLDTILPGQMLIIRVGHFTSEAIGEMVSNTFSVSSKQADPDPSNNTATVTVTVGPPVPRIDFAQIDGKSLIVGGQGFDDGAKVEINGEAVKTIKGEQLVLQRLIAKKGGKRIAPGDTATLHVLNPDGTRSIPFLFTRPLM